jgi:rSAM/selenodomain-associated transferase 2
LSRAPRLSIIIPTRNEEQAIASLLRSLARQDQIDDCQVLVIDGQSVDETAELAAAFPFVEIVSSKPGLINQMNFGAQHANAEALWFLHADTTLPESRTVSLILNALNDPEVVGGACRFHLRGDDLYYKLINSLVNLRARMLGRAYGDQGIFARTAIFRQLGGFRDLPSCSDLDLVLRLRKYGQVRILTPRVETSARTWQRYGKLTTTAYHLREWLGFEWDRLMRKKSTTALQP